MSPEPQEGAGLTSWCTWDVWVISCSRKVEKNFILYFFNHVSLPHQYINTIQGSRNVFDGIQPQQGVVGLVYYTTAQG